MASDKKKGKAISAEEFDRKFDNGEEVPVDWSKATKQLHLKVPVWLIKRMDQEAKRRGVDRQALVLMWLVDRADALNAPEVNVIAGAGIQGAGSWYGTNVIDDNEDEASSKKKRA